MKGELGRARHFAKTKHQAHPGETPAGKTLCHGQAMCGAAGRSRRDVGEDQDTPQHRAWVSWG